MKKILTLIVLFLSFHHYYTQSTEDKRQVEKMTMEILKGFETGNASMLNAYVDPNIGVGVIFNNDGNYGFVLNEDVDFNMPLGFIKKRWAIKNKFPIQWNISPSYDSANLMWRKEGLFVESNSDIIQYYVNQYFSEDAKKQQIFEINWDPKNCVYVTLAENTDDIYAPNGFRFILTKVKDRWILSFIDVAEYES